MRLIQNYEIVREIGRGAFGRVFLATNEGKEFAIKETLASGEFQTFRCFLTSCRASAFVVNILGNSIGG